MFTHLYILFLNKYHTYPSYNSVKASSVQLNSNADIIHYNGSDIKLGQLFLTIFNTNYISIRDGGIPFTVPIEPPPIKPVHGANATWPQINKVFIWNK